MKIRPIERKKSRKGAEGIPARRWTDPGGDPEIFLFNFLVLSDLADFSENVVKCKRPVVKNT